MTSRVPFVNYPLQYRQIKKEIDQAISQTLEAGDLILRQAVTDFENRLAELLGVKYAVGTNSCTDSLIFSLRAAGIKAGDEVITVSHTFFATIEAIVHCGARPILIDVGADYLMDMSQLEAAITAKTRTVLPVHLNGRVCQMDKLIDICQRHHLLIIEDAAQALGATFNNQKAGSFGLAGCFSFYPAKILGAYGDAGAVVTNDEAVAEKIKLLRNHGMKSKTEFIAYGFTSRLDNLQAAILNVKMNHLQDWISRRQQIAAIYDKGLADLDQIKRPATSDDLHFDVFQNYVLRAERRDQLAQYLKEKGIETLIKDPLPLHHHPLIGLSHFRLPLSEQLAKEVISLPLYPELTDGQIDYVIDQIHSFYQNS